MGYYNCQHLIDKNKGKFTSWNANQLCMTRRVVVAKSVKHIWLSLVKTQNWISYLA